MFRSGQCPCAILGYTTSVLCLRYPCSLRELTYSPSRFSRQSLSWSRIDSMDVVRLQRINSTNGSMQKPAPWYSSAAERIKKTTNGPGRSWELPLLNTARSMVHINYNPGHTLGHLCTPVTNIILELSQSSWQPNPQQRHTTPAPTPQSTLPYPPSRPQAKTSSSPAAAQASDPKSQKPLPSPERQASPS
jgi:hypothetical protein